MKRTTKRWACWGPAIAIAGIYGISLVAHHAARGNVEYPVGVTGFAIMSVLTLVYAGDRLGTAQPTLVYVHTDEKPEVRRQSRRTLQPANTDSTPFADRIQDYLERHSDEDND